MARHEFAVCPRILYNLNESESDDPLPMPTHKAGLAATVSRRDRFLLENNRVSSHRSGAVRHRRRGLALAFERDDHRVRIQRDERTAVWPRPPLPFPCHPPLSVTRLHTFGRSAHRAESWLAAALFRDGPLLTPHCPHRCRAHSRRRHDTVARSKLWREIAQGPVIVLGDERPVGRSMRAIARSILS